MYQKTRIAIVTLSMVLFPLTFYYLSPFLAVMGAAEGVVSGSLIVFIMLFLSSLFFGRAFCSWICPAGAIQDILIQSRSKRINVRRVGWIKYVLWVPWIITILLMFKRAGGVKELNFFYQTEMGVSITRPEAAIMFGCIVVLFYLLSMILGRRGSCHAVCWMAPFMVLGKKLGQVLKIPSVVLKRESSKCISCKKCSDVCVMSLRVENLALNREFSDHDCILCGKCINVCPHNVIKLGISSN